MICKFKCFSKTYPLDEHLQLEDFEKKMNLIPFSKISDESFSFESSTDVMSYDKLFVQQFIVSVYLYLLFIFVAAAAVAL
jgi:hypothetical protein